MKGNFTISRLTYKRKISHLFNGKLTSSDVETPFNYEEEGEATSAITGKITKSSQRGKVGIRNAKVTAYKNNRIYDFVYTHNGKDDSGRYDMSLEGNYYLYLESGTYDIKIESESYNRTIKDYSVNDGVKLYRKLFKSGQIKNKYPEDEAFLENTAVHNVVTFQSFLEDNGVEIDLKEALVTGTIRDQYNLPVNDAELIIADSKTKEVKAFVKTKQNGRFSFVLGLGKYDIILRSPKYNAKIVRGYDFESFENGFLFDILNKNHPDYNNSLKNGGDWLWISN